MALAGVFQTFDGAENDPLSGATDYTVLSVQDYEGRVVINEVCRVYLNRTKASPTKSLLAHVEQWLQSMGVEQVSMFVEDPPNHVMMPGEMRSGGPVSLNGTKLLGIYSGYGYRFEGWLDEQEFIIVKDLPHYNLRSWS